MARIASLHIYPVKSCRGINLDRARLGATGLEHDRQWMVVDRNGRFVSQRSHPHLATVDVAMTAEGLMLQAPNRPPLLVSDVIERVQRVRIWKDDCEALDGGDAAAEWFSKLLGDRLRLVRYDPNRPRRVANSEHTVAFADGYPLLVISRASLTDLNSRLLSAVPMGRFRPNIVMDDMAAYEEDRAGTFAIGNIILRGAKACTRCTITTTDQQDGSRNDDGEPLRTLRGYRYDPALRGVTFGQNCVIEAGIGSELHVGAEVGLGA